MLQHVTMEMRARSAENATAAWLTGVFENRRLAPRPGWFARDVQARMALLPPGASLPPATTVTLYTLERGLVVRDLELDSDVPHEQRLNSCMQFLAGCEPVWAGDQRSKETCKRPPAQRQRECAAFRAVATQVAQSQAGREHLRTRCAVDRRLWHSVAQEGGRRLLGPWADEMAAQVWPS